MIPVHKSEKADSVHLPAFSNLPASSTRLVDFLTG